MAEQTIQAISIDYYGKPDVLKIKAIPRPAPKEGEVLVRVHAAGVNPVDWKITEGFLKDFRPIQFPHIPGRDLAGVVEKVGPGNSIFTPGQAVFGQSAYGTFTQYAAASVNALALKPESLSYDEAATIPVGATTAWQGLFDHGHLQPGQRVLIVGGAGGVGFFAVQFAHGKGAEVVSTTSTDNVAFVRSLGAETVIDYTQTSVESTVSDIDLVFDTVGGPNSTYLLSVLKRGGTYVGIAGQPDEIKAQEYGIRVVRFSAQVNSELLRNFAHLIDTGQIRTAINHVFPLHEAPHAIELSETGHGRGRIVLHVE